MINHQPMQHSNNTFFGKAGKLGSEEMTTFVTLSPDVDPVTGAHAPVAAGVEFSAALLQNPPDEKTMLAIDFPIQAARTPYQYMMINWNPHGHEPAGIYDKAHFDFHFYIQDFQDVMAIKPGTCEGIDCADYQEAVKDVPAQYLPANYMNRRAVAPFMGNHLRDMAAPEWTGHPFTRTLLLGSDHGRITFLEPMITLAALMAEPNLCSDIKQPASFAKSDYYPRSYCTQYDETTKKYRVYLSNWIYRSATQQ